MISKEENELLTRVGPGTPAGELLRRYWQPAGLCEELAAGAPVPVRLLGEDLVLFREPSTGSGQAGKPGLLGIHCSHRGADLSYGRLEDGGLRCIYHGWLYDIHGRCLEQPGELRNAEFGMRNDEPGPHSAIRNPQSAIKHKAYPCQERAGLIFAYLGPGEPPLLPNYEFLCAPEGYSSAGKTFQECNYLQGNEGNLDPAHLSFLHRMAPDDTEAGIRQFLNARATSPRIEPEITDFGVRIYAVRPVAPDRNYVRVTNFILPNFSAVTGHRDGYGVNWHVPIDDEHHWRYGISFRRSGPMQPASRWTDSGGRDFQGSSRLGAQPQAGRQAQTDKTSDYRLTRNKSNRYLQDREEMKTRTFIGLGPNFIVHDTCATEGAGPIQDRTQEHLGYTDRGIFAARQVLLGAIRAVQEGRDPPHVIRDAEKNHFPHIVARNDVLLPSDVDWHNFWEKEGVEIVDTTDVAAGGARRSLAE